MNRTKLWNELYQKTNELTTPNSIDNLLSIEEINDLEKSIIQVLNLFLEQGELHKGIKVYVDKVLRNDFIEIMAANRPQENESLENWGQQIFGDNKFGVVFNSLEFYDNAIAEQMCSIAAPLIKTAGLPLGGLSFLFFMGNYGFTPFGIHKEAVGEEGFLFHLGPGVKEFFAWNTDELNEIEHNTIVFHEVEKMLPSAKKYVLNPASVMFVPHKVYHIANTEEFSLSIVMDYINPSQDYLEKELAKKISTQNMVKNRGKSFLAPLKTNNGQAAKSYIDSKSIIQKFRQAFDKRVLMLKSNAGLLQHSIRNTKKRLPNNHFQIKGKKIFPIYLHKIDDENTLVFARGHEIIKKSNSNLEFIISSLNNGETLSFRFLKDSLTPHWDLIEIYGFLNELISFEAIETIGFEE